MSHVLRIVHLEDDAGAADLVTGALERAGLEALVERVDCEAAFRRALEALVPDVVLGDNDLPGFSATAALELMRAVGCTAPLIVVPGALDAATVVATFKAGAEDLVLKSDLSRLGAAIAAALAVRRPLARLSPRQLEVLQLMAEGLSTRAIARRLTLSAKTVEAHRSEVMRRLGIYDVAGLARYAVRVGLVAPYPGPLYPGNAGVGRDGASGAPHRGAPTTGGQPDSTAGRISPRTSERSPVSGAAAS